MRPLSGMLMVVALASPILAAGRPMTVDDLLAVQGISDPQVSPDGKRIVYAVSAIDRETNKSRTQLWMVPTAGGEPQQFTTTPGSNSHPRWSPDGKTIAFQSDRSGSSQVWLLPVDGGEARQLTKLPIDVSGPIWSPKGDALVVAGEVYPGKTPEETAEKDKAAADGKVSKVRTFDQLMVRHWTAWDEKKRSHLFVVDVKTGKAVDATPHLDVNTPPAPFGGSSDYTFAPGGEELIFTAEPRKDLAWSTNTDIWSVPVAGGEARNLTVENLAADAQPSVSPDGKWLAYVTQARPGFEADQWILKVRNRASGAVRPVAANLDRSIVSYTWSADSQHVYAVLDDAGRESIARLPILGDPMDVKPLAHDPRQHRLVTGGRNDSVQVTPDGTMVYLKSTTNRPAELYRASADGTVETALTKHNAELLAQLDLPAAEPFSFEGADGDTVTGWLVRPPGFVATKKYPVIVLIHGGPQSAWHDEWHNRWNYELFAAPGYAVVAINPRGSTGFGQKFTDQISQDWTGRVYDDLMAGVDHALKAYPFLDGSKMAAAGGSYGGFMVNWIAGHSDRFKALVSHAGVFDLNSMYFTTEELWFAEWEFGGTPWDNPKLYGSQSPSLFVKNFATPTLVIHGALDFRVPDAQGLGMFTALQRRGVPSRLVYYPDEGHWILKPQNRVAWWNEVHGWLKTYLK